MPALPKIPPDLRPEILKRRGQGKSPVETVKWLSEEHGIKVTARAVQKTLARIDKERAPIAQAVAERELSGKVIADLQGFDGIIRRAEKDERAAEKGEADLADVERELTGIVNADIADFMNPDGTMKAFDKIPEEKRRALASVEFEELFVESTTDDGVKMKQGVGRITKFKIWDKNVAAKQLVDVRERKVARELALKAREQQLKARETRLEMAGAKPSGTETRRVVVLPPVRPVAEEPETQPITH